MQPINGFDQVQAIHGRQGTLPGGPYVVRVLRAKEDVTGYGNRCLKVVYEIIEGEHANRFADIAGDEEQDWRHTAEIDIVEANGARLKALVDAVQASNQGYVWDWNEHGLKDKVFGLVLQERKVTVKKGKNKGRDRTYLDFWDAVPADMVRQGAVPVPPVNDKRDNKGGSAPITVPQGFDQPQAPVAPAPQAPQYQPQYQPQVQYQQPQQTQYQQPMQQVPVQQPQQAPVAGVYDSDIPF